MSCIVKYKRKGTNNLYAYESTSYWIPGVGPRTKKKYLGRYDPSTGEIIPSKKRTPKESAQTDSTDPGANAGTEMPATSVSQAMPVEDKSTVPSDSHLPGSEFFELKNEIMGMRTDIQELNMRIEQLSHCIEELLIKND